MQARRAIERPWSSARRAAGGGSARGGGEPTGCCLPRFAAIARMLHCCVSPLNKATFAWAGARMCRRCAHTARTPAAAPPLPPSRSGFCCASLTLGCRCTTQRTCMRLQGDAVQVSRSEGGWRRGAGCGLVEDCAVEAEGCRQRVQMVSIVLNRGLCRGGRGMTPAGADGQCAELGAVQLGRRAGPAARPADGGYQSPSLSLSVRAWDGSCSRSSGCVCISRCSTSGSGWAASFREYRCCMPDSMPVTSSVLSCSRLFPWKNREYRPVAAVSECGSCSKALRSRFSVLKPAGGGRCSGTQVRL